MKIKNLFFVLASIMMLTGCYSKEIEALQNQMETFKKTSIDPLSEQLDRVDKSVKTIEQAREQLSKTVAGLTKAQEDLQNRINDANQKIAELSGSQTDDYKGLIKQLSELRDELEGKLAVVNASIDELRAKDSALEKRIDDLKKFVDEKFVDVYGEYTRTADIIAGIEEDLKWTKQAIINLDETLSDKIDDFSAGLEGEIKTAVETVTQAYKDAISQAKTDILFEVDERIETAITESKDKILNWVNDELLIKYYKAAQIDEMINILERADSTIADDIVALKSDLETAKADLNKAIGDAIEALKIDDKIAAAIGKVTPQIEELRKTLEGSLDDLTTLQQKITSLETQARKMEESKEALETMDTKLQGFITELQGVSDKLTKDLNEAKGDIDIIKDSLAKHRQAISAIESNIALINAQIGQLKKADEEINREINDLATAIDEIRKGVDGKIVSAKEWANKSFVTLEEYGKTAELAKTIDQNVTSLGTRVTKLRDSLMTEIGKVDTKVMEALSNAEKDIKNAYSEDITKAVAKLDSSMKNWVSTKLEKEYLKAEATQAKLNALQEAYEGKDAVHEKLLDSLSTALSTLQEKIEKTCKDCIAEAVLDSGVIGKKISEKIKEFDEKIQPQFTGIDSKLKGLEERMMTVEGKISTQEEQIRGLQNGVAGLKHIDTTLYVWIDKIKSIIGDVPEDYKSTIMADLKTLSSEDQTIKGLISNLETSIKSGDISSTIKGWINSSLENYYTAQKINDTLAVINSNIKKTKDDLDSLAKRVTKVENLTKEGGDIQLKIAAVDEYCKGVVSNYYTITQINDLFNNYYKKTETYSKDQIDEMLKVYYKETDGKKYIDEQIKKLGNVATTEGLDKAVSDAKNALTDAYIKYVSDACTNENGVIRKAISEAITAVKGGYTGTMKDIADKVDELLAKTASLESMVQSIVYVPASSDGTILMNWGYNQGTGALEKYDSESIRFKINTNDVERFNEKYESFNYVANAVITRTKAATPGSIVSLSISYKKFDKSSSILTVQVAGDGLDDDFYNGKVGASISLTISDGTTNIASEYIPFFANAKSTKPMLWLDKYSVTVPDYRGGDSYKQTVTVTAEGSWTATSQNDWITVSPTSGTGNKQITITASQCNVVSGRTGTVTVKSTASGAIETRDTKTLEVQQTGRTAQIINHIEDHSIDFSYLGETGVMVTTEDGISDWDFEPKTDDNFIISKVVNGNVGSQSGFTGLVVQAKAVNDNPKATTKSVNISVIPATNTGNVTFTFTQNGRNPQVLTVTPENEQTTVWRGAEVTYQVIPDDGMNDWTVSDGTRLIEPDTTTTPWTVKYTPVANTSSSENTITLSFTPDPRIGGNTVKRTIKQDARPVQTLSYDRSDGNIAVNWKGTGGHPEIIKVTVTSEDKMNDWDIKLANVKGTEGWVDYTKADGKTQGESTVTITVNPRTGETAADWKNQEDREATLTITPSGDGAKKVFTITQEKRNKQTLEIKHNSQVVTSPITVANWKGEGEYKISVKPDDNVKDWTVSADGEWLSGLGNITKKDDGSADITLKASRMMESEDMKNGRECTLTFVPAVGDSIKIAVKQSKRDPQNLTLEYKNDLNDRRENWKSIGNNFEYDWKEHKVYIRVTPEDKVNDWTIDRDATSSWIDYGSINYNKDGQATVSFTIRKIETKEEQLAGRQGKIVFLPKVGDPREVVVNQSARPSSNVNLNGQQNLTLTWENTYSQSLNISQADGEIDYSPKENWNLPNWMKVDGDYENPVYLQPTIANRGNDSRTSKLEFFSWDGTKSTLTLQQNKDSKFYADISNSGKEFTGKILSIKITFSFTYTMSTSHIRLLDNGEAVSVKYDGKDFPTERKDGPKNLNKGNIEISLPDNLEKTSIVFEGGAIGGLTNEWHSAGSNLTLTIEKTASGYIVYPYAK